MIYHLDSGLENMGHIRKYMGKIVELVDYLIKPWLTTEKNRRVVSLGMLKKNFREVRVPG